MKQIISDVDGVLNNGQFLYDSSGKQYKTFGPHDTDGVKLLKQHGWKVEFISADKRGFDITKKRVNDMGCKVTLVSEDNRFKWVDDNFGLSDIVYVGDGIHDAKILKHSKLGFAPSNSTIFAKESANVILNASGGFGVFLEIAVNLLKLEGTNFE